MLTAARYGRNYTPRGTHASSHSRRSSCHKPSEVGSGADAPLERSGFGAFSQFAFAYLWLNHDPGVKAEAEPSTRVLLEAICGDLMNSEPL